MKSAPTLKDELIEDRELPTAMEDQLGHLSIAKQLAELARSVPAPSNVALFGPWGSGKSSIANLLGTELASEKRVKYARFDAFKYAENPLRRNFVNAVAVALGIDKKKYRDDLYQSRSHTDYEVPVAKLAKLVGIFSGILVVCALIGIAISAVISLFADTGFWTSFLSLGRGAAISALVPASILTALVAFVGKTFVIEKRVEKAESDEQFERLFKDLVDESGADRLVIFVDELDRCAPAEVVSTLDAIRTFLGVPKCVFIVAADQQVLEQALSESVKQATPTDTLNPYYSSGSAYLDKVFQYHLALPPLLPQKVSQFAADLARGKKGIWTRVDIDLVVSILVPSHVRSPRRVKNLLNSFVLFCHQAERRANERQVDLDLVDRIDEIAKLVCLRVEFPLFARDLVVDSRLPEYIIRIREEGNGSVWKDYKHVTTDVREIATRYANLEAEVDYSFAESEPIDEEKESDAEKPASIIGKEQHGRQLLDYLTRTQSVSGPKRDIIHLQSAGNLFGLDASLVDSIEQLAQDGSLTRMASRVESLSSTERLAVISLLTQQARTALGVEAMNVAKVLLSVAGIVEVDLSEHASAAVEAVAPVVVKNPRLVDRTTVVGAWKLVAMSPRPIAARLRTVILESEALADDPKIAQVIFSNSREVFKSNRKQAVDFVFGKITSKSPGEWYKCFRSIDSGCVPELIDDLSSMGLSKHIEALIKRHAKWKTEQAKETTAATSAAPTTPTSTAQDAQEPISGRESLEILGQWVIDLDSEDHTSAESLMIILLDVQLMQSRLTAGKCLGQIQPVTSPACAAKVLHEMTWVDTEDWPAWTKALASASVTGGDVVASLRMAIDDLWSIALEHNESDFGQFEQAAHSLTVLLDKLPLDERREITFTPSDLDKAIVTTEDVVRHQKMRQVLGAFLRGGIATPEAVDQLEARSLVQTFKVEGSFDDELTGHILNSAHRFLSRHEDTKPTEVQAGLIHDVLDSITGCEWLLPLPKKRAQLHAWSIVGVREANIIDFPDSKELLNLFADRSTRETDSIAHWIKARRHSVEDIADVARVFSRSTSTLLTTALSDAILTLSKEERTNLLELSLGDPSLDPPSAQVSKILVTSDQAAELPGILVRRFELATNNAQRKATLTIWSHAGVTGNGARRVAIEKVLIPMLRMNRQALEYALETLPQFAPIPKDLRSSIVSAITPAAERDAKLERRVIDTLKGLGFRTRKDGLFFGFRKEVLDD